MTGKQLSIWDYEPPVHYNTTEEVDADLEKCKGKAAVQDNAVRKYFAEHKTGAPSAVHHWLIAKRELPPLTPLTSVRRAMTNLTNRAILRRTDEKQAGPYGRREYVWEREGRKW